METERPFRLFAIPDESFGYPYRLELIACNAMSVWDADHFAERRIDIRDVVDRVVAQEHTRVGSLFHAVLSLALDGFGAEALMLGRPMIESVLTAWWAAAHPDSTKELFPLHERFLWVLHAEAHAHPNPPSAEFQDELSGEDRASAEKLFGQYGQRPWTGKSNWQLLDEWTISTVESQPEDEEGALYFRDFIARTLNWSLHSTAFALDLNAARTPDEVLHLHVGPTDAHVRDALVLAQMAYGNILEAMVERFDPDLASDLDQFLRRSTVDFNGWSGTARNDPCPCGTGRKFKQCHGRT